MSALQQAAEEDDELAELLEASGNDAGVVEAKASGVTATPAPVLTPARFGSASRSGARRCIARPPVR